MAMGQRPGAMKGEGGGDGSEEEEDRGGGESEGEKGEQRTSTAEGGRREGEAGLSSMELLQWLIFATIAASIAVPSLFEALQRRVIRLRM
jgi:hypothetical protein